MPDNQRDDTAAIDAACRQIIDWSFHTLSPVRKEWCRQKMRAAIDAYNKAREDGHA